VSRPVKLTADDVEQIRLLHGFETTRSLAKQFGVSNVMIWRIVNGHSHKARDEEPRGDAKRNSAKLIPSEVLAIRRLAREETPRPVLAERFGVSIHAIHKIIQRANWCDLEEPVIRAPLPSRFYGNLQPRYGR
jgi:predicted DNA-binding protein (UPF0251 family)